jgi:hypothetical protein
LSDGRVVICKNGHDPIDSTQADAQLIAAAPDLLAACEVLLEYILGETDNPKESEAANG